MNNKEVYNELIKHEVTFSPEISNKKDGEDLKFGGVIKNIFNPLNLSEEEKCIMLKVDDGIDVFNVYLIGEEHGFFVKEYGELKLGQLIKGHGIKDILNTDHFIKTNNKTLVFNNKKEEYKIITYKLELIK